jgi:uncharacterized protein (TIGR03435 family)
MQIGPRQGAPAPAGDGSIPSANTPDGGNEASLFSVMEKQLGLTVEKRVLPTEMLVIDHLDRIPTEN